MNRVFLDDIKFINGLWQIRCNSLAPKGFDWTDNGINTADVDMIDSVTGTMLADQETIRPGMYFAFNESRVNDTGEVVKDHGYITIVSLTLHHLQALSD